MQKRNQNSNTFAFASEEDAVRALKRDGALLRRIAMTVWQQYEASYTPERYIRTGDTLRSMKLTHVYRKGLNEYVIALTYDNDLVYHDSVFKGGKQGHTIMLIGGWERTEMGWKVKTGWHKDIKRFGYWEGFDYIGTVQRRYEALRNKAIDFEVEWSGKALR